MHVIEVDCNDHDNMLTWYLVFTLFFHVSCSSKKPK